MPAKPFDIRLTGDRSAQLKLRRIKQRTPEAVNAALFIEGLAIFEESQPQVPVDTGRLRASGVVAPSGSLLKFRVVIGYGTDYALAVHERREVHHNVGKAGYLEDPFRERIAGMLQRVADRAEGFTAKGRRPPRPTRRKGSRVVSEG